MSQRWKVVMPALAWLAIASGLAIRNWFAGTSGIYLDEAQVIGISSRSELSALPGFLADHEAHPPAYYLLLRAWFTIFGSSTESAIALSLVLGTAVIPLAYGLVHRLGGTRGDATAAAWLVALSPTAVRYSGMVRPYALLGLVIVVTLWWLLEFLRTGTWRNGLGYAAGAVVMVYTHNWSWLVLAAAGLVCLVLLRLRNAPRARAIRLAAIHGLILVLSLPWLPSLLHQASGAGHFFVKDLGATIAEVTWVLSGVPVGQALLIAAALVVLAVAHRRAGSPTPPPGSTWVGLFLAIVGLTSALALMLSPVTPLLVSQCYAMFTPTLMAALAISIGVDRAPRLLSRLVLAVCLLAFAGRIAVMSNWLRSDIREIGRFLSQRQAPTDLVLIYPDYPAPTLTRYFVPRGPVFTYANSGLPFAIPFDRRVARDTDPAAHALLNAEIARAAAAGIRLWYLTIENPSDYPPRRLEVERTLESHFGRPTCVVTGAARPRLYEDMQLVLYGGVNQGVTVPPCA